MADRDNSSLDKYMDEIKKEQLLTEVEERTLAGRVQAGDRHAVDRFTKANLRLGVSVARAYQNNGVAMEDLVSEGNIGLMRAVERYDASRGCRFASYAVPIVRKYIERAIEEQGALYRIPKGEASTVDKRSGKALSADAPLGGRENVNLLSIIANPDSPETDSSINASGLSDELNRLLDILDERESTVLKYFFGIGCEKMTLADIGHEMGLKRERVRQIRDKAMRKISRSAGVFLKSYRS